MPFFLWGKKTMLLNAVLTRRENLRFFRMRVGQEIVFC
jgi:hypothetical protein